ncbi:MAG: alpha/beta hydrolase family protein [Oligoflexales bacterium]
MATEKVVFLGSHEKSLSGSLDLPEGDVRFYAIFAHCFTCSKDIAAASRISRELARFGIGVLRFDFTGLGRSEGEFSNSNFSSNVQDLIAANTFLEKRFKSAKLLIGHSLGGAAVIFASKNLPESTAVVTIGAPFEPSHVLHNFRQKIEEIQNEGQAQVHLAGRPFEFKKQFLDDVIAQNPKEVLRGMKKALLVFHSPQDSVVGIENAQNIYQHAKHPKSFISLDGADHLLSQTEDAQYVAATLAAWADRYI